MLKIKHVPGQLFEVIAIPVVFTLMFTYLFGGALAGSRHRYPGCVGGVVCRRLARMWQRLRVKCRSMLPRPCLSRR